MIRDLHTRRQFLSLTALGATGLLAGCVTQSSPPDGAATAPAATPTPEPVSSPLRADGFDYDRIYGPVSDGGFNIPAVPYQQIPEQFLRQNVLNTTGEGPGTLVVDTRNNFVYYTLPRGRAMRYGVGLGRAGFEWSGRGVIEAKREWPRWHPPAEMIDREPKLEKYRTTFNRATGEYEGGMEPGLLNPLGARGLYIYQDGKDTLYRLHGSPEWNSIGRNVSSGCVRLMNQDIIDLYSRVPQGTEIIVK